MALTTTYIEPVVRDPELYQELQEATVIEENDAACKKKASAACLQVFRENHSLQDMAMRHVKASIEVTREVLHICGPTENAEKSKEVDLEETDEVLSFVLTKPEYSAVAVHQDGTTNLDRFMDIRYFFYECNRDSPSFVFEEKFLAFKKNTKSWRKIVSITFLP